MSEKTLRCRNCGDVEPCKCTPFQKWVGVTICSGPTRMLLMNDLEHCWQAAVSQERARIAGELEWEASEHDADEELAVYEVSVILRRVARSLRSEPVKEVTK